MLLVSLDCPFFIAASVFYNVYSLYIFHYINCGNTNSKLERGESCQSITRLNSANIVRLSQAMTLIFIVIYRCLFKYFIVRGGMVMVFNPNFNNTSVILLKAAFNTITLPPPPNHSTNKKIFKLQSFGVRCIINISNETGDTIFHTSSLYVQQSKCTLFVPIK